MSALPDELVQYARRMMVEGQIRTWDVLDPRVTDLLLEMPRDRFVPQRYRDLAYADMQVPLGGGQVMMAPKVEGRMLQALNVQPDDEVFEIGTGSGFITACLAKLGNHVTSCDIRTALLPGARAALAELGLADRVELSERDGSQLGWLDRRYDALCVTGSVPVLDEDFQQHLNVGGRLFVIVGQAPAMEALLITRIAEDEWTRESLFETVLPPLDNVKAPSPFVF